jgi:hypothetical protein
MNRKAVVGRANLSGYRETRDGKYYIMPNDRTHTMGANKFIYSIGMNTPNGCVHIEDVKGFKESVQRLREIIQEAQSE